MDNHETIAQLLESLIKMVGKGNQRIESLQKRVCQLECAIREREVWEASSESRYAATTPPASAETH